jgi:hypothetical protein
MNIENQSIQPDETFAIDHAAAEALANCFASGNRGKDVPSELIARMKDVIVEEWASNLDFLEGDVLWLLVEETISKGFTDASIDPTTLWEKVKERNTPDTLEPTLAELKEQGLEPSRTCELVFERMSKADMIKTYPDESREGNVVFALNLFWDHMKPRDLDPVYRALKPLNDAGASITINPTGKI